MLSFITQAQGAGEAPLLDIERLMNEHGDSLLRLCFMYLKDFHTAEDAVQETFVRAYAKYHTFRGDCTEKTWLTRIAINICKDMMRKRSFDEKPPEEALPDRADPSPTPEEEVLDRARSRALMEEVTRLEPIYREVVLLFYYSGLKVQEIAIALNTREGTVKTRLMRARARLAQVLKEEEL